ncbi:glycosyltransferase family 4 protein [Deltaproteobacteria bacterium]|nr:glycosyltransferase family 4 protein [Deltaproteobacteria bacterium]
MPTSGKSDEVRPLHILMLLSNAFDPDPRVHREALALIDAGHQVTILCWDRDRKAKADEVIDGIHLVRVYVDSSHGRGSTQMLYLLAFWLKAFFLGRKMSFDVVHAHDFDTLPLGYILARLKKAKLVYDSHESYVDMLFTLPAFLRKSIESFENILLKKTDLVITVGELLQNHLQQRGARNICVVGNWQDPDKFLFTDGQLQAEKDTLGIRDEQLIIAFIANLGRDRRIAELIDVVSKNPSIHLILGGLGPCAEQVQDAANQFPNITYLGHVHPSRVPLYTAVADIIFYGFDPDSPNAKYSAPNKLFECLAAGKSVLTGDFGEIAKIVRAEECGIVLPDYSVENISAALDAMTPEKMATYNRNSLAAGRDRYSWALAAQTLLTHYNAL